MAGRHAEDAARVRIEDRHALRPDGRRAVPEQYYDKNGESTNQVTMIRPALKVASRLYGHAVVSEFGPIALKACRAEFVRRGLSRHECNRRTNLIKQAYRWGTENEMVLGLVRHTTDS
jgi:hypothetical protein